jgi:hypothetical protein
MALSKQLLDLHGRNPIKRTISCVLTFIATPPKGAKISLRAIAAFNHDKMAADERYIGGLLLIPLHLYCYRNQ